jgi:hypothetical protein
MKTFRVTEIVTTADGRIRLNGPAGSLEIQRRGDASYAMLWRKDAIVVEQVLSDHFLSIDEIPMDRDTKHSTIVF